MIYYHNINNSYKIKNKRILKKVVENICKDYSLMCNEVNIVLVDFNYILDLNRSALNHDYYTDIITFDYSDINQLSGDLYVCIDMIKENALEYGKSIENELNRVIIHGVLHLVGLKDKSAKEKQIMTKMEDKYLDVLASFLVCST